MTNQAGPSNQPSPGAQAQAAARTEDGGRDADRLRPNASKPPIKPCKCFEFKKGRNLVVCIDGTSNQFGTNNTNVVELYSLIKSHDTNGNEQLTFYNSGIGTYAEPSWKSLNYLKQVLDHMIDMAIAWNFETIIIVAYLWLSEHYQPGDRIFLFGFSRGAYQVRALAAMMAKVGLIKKGNQAQIPFAYQLYAACGTKDTSKVWEKLSKLIPEKLRSSKTKPTAEAMAEYFRRVFAREVNIHFIGAWDTVSSVGTVRDKTLPGTTDGMPQACCFRHAMALDERRVKFLPEYAHGGTSLPAVEPVNESDSSTNRRTAGKTAGKAAGRMADEAAGEMSETAGKTSETTGTTSRRIHTKEVWFAGTHSDIGGGNVENPAMDRTRPPLRWMAFEAAAEGLHLSTIDRNLTPDEKIDVHESLVWYWWVLEVLPVKRLSYKSKGKDSTWRPHGGAARIIQEGQKIHSSLLPARKDENQGGVTESDQYVPKACRYDVQKKDNASWWSLLRNSDSKLGQERRKELVEYDLYDRARILVGRYPTDLEYGLERQKVLSEIYQFASSAQGLLAVRQANFSGAILSATVEGFGAEDLRRVMKIMGSEGAPQTLGRRSERRRQLSALLEGDGDPKDRQTAEEFLDKFTYECLVLPGHDGTVSSVAFSPDGTHVASGSYDGTIRIWDAQTGKTVGEPLRGYTHRVMSVAFSPDGTRIVSGSFDNTGRIWDARSGEPVGEPLRGHTDGVMSVAFSPDGTRIVSGSFDNTIRIWDARSGEPVGEPLRGHTWVMSVAFSPDGTRIVSGSSDENHIWDAGTREPVGEPLEGHTDWVRSVAFSPDGTRIVSGSDDRTIRIWDAGTREPVGEPLQGHTSGVNAVDFSPDGTRIVSGSDDETIRIWDATTGQPVGEPLQGHTDWVTSVAFSPDGKVIASGSDDKTVRLWDVESYVDAAKTGETH